MELTPQDDSLALIAQPNLSQPGGSRRDQDRLELGVPRLKKAGPERRQRDAPQRATGQSRLSTFEYFCG